MTQDVRAPYLKAMEYAVRYRASLRDHAGKPPKTYAELRDELTGPLPEHGSSAEQVLDELVAGVEGGLMPMTGPRFFGWVIGASHPAGVAADWMVSAWGQNVAFHTPTPALAAIEEVAEAWLLDILDLPRQSRIGFVTGGTVANAVCLAAARTRVLLDVGWDPDADGLFGAPPVEVLIGADAHSSVFSSLQLIGFGNRRVTRIEADDQGRMLPNALAAALQRGDGPRVVIAQAGQINTGACDPFEAIVDVAKAAGAWLHVDGAFGLWARASTTRRHLTAGVEGADSWATDGHKWLQVPYDCGFAIIRDREAHARSMTQWSSYLPTIDGDDRVPSAFVPELSRRGRATPVWAMLKAFGRTGVAEMVDRHCALARRMGSRLATEPGVRVLNDVVLNQVVVTFGDGAAEDRKAATAAVISRVQEGGVCFVAGAAWHEEWAMRISITSVETTEADVDQSADAILDAWRAVRAAQA